MFVEKESENQKDGYMWKIKEDGTYDKFKVEVAFKEKKGTEVIKRSKMAYEIRTFIGNEKLN